MFPGELVFFFFLFRDFVVLEPCRRESNTFARYTTGPSSKECMADDAPSSSLPRSSTGSKFPIGDGERCPTEVVLARNGHCLFRVFVTVYIARVLSNGIFKLFKSKVRSSQDHSSNQNPSFSSLTNWRIRTQLTAGSDENWSRLSCIQVW